jgi:hypothetical protein
MEVCVMEEAKRGRGTNVSEAARARPARRAIESDLEAHDRLPVVVRRALGATIRKWSSESALECLEVYGYTPNALVETIRNMDWDHAIREGGGKHNPSQIG